MVTATRAAEHRDGSHAQTQGPALAFTGGLMGVALGPGTSDGCDRRPEESPAGGAGVPSRLSCWLAVSLLSLMLSPPSSSSSS